MNVLKTIFWTTIFWVVLLLIVFVYAKYTTSGAPLANSIAKQLGVMPASEMMVDTGAMAATGADLMMMQETLMTIDANVAQLLEFAMPTSEIMPSTTTGSAMMNDTTDTTTSDMSDETDAMMREIMAE